MKRFIGYMTALALSFALVLTVAVSMANASEKLQMQGTTLTSGAIVLVTNYSSEPEDKVQCGNAKIAVGVLLDGTMGAGCWVIGDNGNVLVKWSETVVVEYDADKFAPIDVEALRKKMHRDVMQEMQV